MIHVHVMHAHVMSSNVILVHADVSEPEGSRSGGGGMLDHHHDLRVMSRALSSSSLESGLASLRALRLQQSVTSGSLTGGGRVTVGHVGYEGWGQGGGRAWMGAMGGGRKGGGPGWV